MPVNRNALIRYKTIDNCLKNRFRKWTLESLMEKVSDALYEYEGMDKGISKRTIQADIQMMRSDKLGYNAPIVVIDKKYYVYQDTNYSITNIPLTLQDLNRMNEAVEILKQFKGFSHFSQLNEVVQKLEDHVHAASTNQNTVIDFEKNENLKGLSFLDQIYTAIVTKKVLNIVYQSFTARYSQQFLLHAWWLKEFKNRWFVIGIRDDSKELLTLALDRIVTLNIAEEEPFVDIQNITPAEYYKDVIGVTVSSTLHPIKVRLWADHKQAPYIETKPFHHSQKIIERNESGIILEIYVQHNMELERELLGYGEGLVVLSPEKLREKMRVRLLYAYHHYKLSDTL